MHAGIDSGKIKVASEYSCYFSTGGEGERQPPSLQGVYELGVVAVYDNVFSSVLNTDFFFFKNSKVLQTQKPDDKKRTPQIIHPRRAYVCG